MTIKELNTVNISSENLSKVSDFDRYYIPCTVNKNEWVLRFDDESGLIWNNEKHFLDRLEMALSLNGGSLQGMENSLKMNGYADVKFVGATTPQEFLKSLSKDSEVDRSFFEAK